MSIHYNFSFSLQLLCYFWDENETYKFTQAISFCKNHTFTEFHGFQYTNITSQKQDTIISVTSHVKQSIEYNIWMKLINKHKNNKNTEEDWAVHTQLKPFSKTKIIFRLTFLIMSRIKFYYKSQLKPVNIDASAKTTVRNRKKNKSIHKCHQDFSYIPRPR